jgi:hypothetical protein
MMPLVRKGLVGTGLTSFGAVTALGMVSMS